MENKKLNAELTAYEAAEDYAEETEVRETEEKVTAITMDDEKLLIAPVGRLDTVTSAELKDKIGSFDYTGSDIELDFADVEYISSAGLRLLVSLHKQTKAAGHTMVIKNINAVVREVFRISGFDKAFTVV